MDSNLTQQELKRILSYDPVTGIFCWLVSTSCVKAGSVCRNKDRHGYIRIMISKKLYFVHRLAFLYMEGEFPPEHVDHINGIPDDNRWSNIRRVSRFQNMRNTKISSRNTSGTTGVTWSKGCGKWQAQISIHGKTKYLGLFADLSDAVKARSKAQRKHGFHPNHGRSA